ncbi:acetyltransferase, ribosomal protein N-acetylase [Shewanella psychrophila]|uniref:Acetyltransferase, ribosomal protein N-acetylase n=1 Tax=Shewanella psychrophila TaxID=225848 RepID=A0A1S6HMN5_9GAMM|nr:GNAT family N-acetyltransferase [Shewanella psychrophila]AQS36787.1 acetyltransferase, ribosomal protein N-acetylase [Shewanella psychrophila]
MIIAETDRLILRQFQARDIHSIFLLNSIPEILTYIPGEPMSSIKQAEEIFADVIVANYEEFGYGRWAVEHKADKKVIGFCGPKYIAEFDEVELGYRYLPEYWGKGYGSEAGKSALDLFTSFGVDEAIALILLGNKGSENLAKKLGMEHRNRDSFMGHKVNVFHKHL